MSGRVQGVGFRYFTLDEAQRLGVMGFVRNLPDGGVEVVVEGGEAEVEGLCERVRRGPTMARVDAVAVTDLTPTGRYQEFRVTH